MSDFRLRSARQTYATLIGIGLGMTLAGLAVPWVVGEPVGTTTTAGAPAGSDLEASDSSAEGTLGDITHATNEGATAGTASGAQGGAGSATATGAGPSPPSPSPSPSPSSSSPAVAVAGAGGATDMGVTPTTVKVAFLLVDLAGVSKIGVGAPGVDPKQQEEGIRVHIEEINGQGGIAGRMIEPYFRSFDVLSKDDMRAACLAATEDAKAFAVVGGPGYEPTAGMCVTKEHKTPLVLQLPAHDGHYAQSEGRMFTLNAGATRLMHMWVHELDRTGQLQGKKIGVLNDERYDPGETMAKTALIPAMNRYGYTITHRSRLSAELSTGASQIPNEVQQMRLKGVEVVLLTANTVYSSQFVQTADAQGWHPTYYTSDWAAMSTDTTNQNMPDSYDKTLGWTVQRYHEELVGIPEPERAAACRERYERETGKQLARKSDSKAYGATIMWCDLFDIALAGLRGAGSELTRARFSDAVQNAGPIPFAIIGGGGFRPGRFDAAELIRMQQWHVDCRCWKPADQFRRTPY